MSKIEAWESLCDFYTHEPLFKKHPIPENPIKKMVLVFFSGRVKAEFVNSAVNEYLEQHQRLLRAHPMDDPFDLRPNVLDVKKHGKNSLREIIQAVYRAKHEYPDSYRQAYEQAIRNAMDWEPYIVNVRSMVRTTTAHLIIGEKNAENFRDYFLEKYKADEPQAIIHQVAREFP
jgi:hypothetical protein